MKSTTATVPRQCEPAPNHPTTISAITFQEPNANSSVTHVLTLISKTDNQSHGGQGTIKDKKLENTDMIDIYSSHKHISGMQNDCNLGDSAV